MPPWDEEAARALEYTDNFSVGLPAAAAAGLAFDTSVLTALFGSAGGGTVTATYTNPITIGSAANRALLVMVFFTGASNGTSVPSSVTWGGTSMAQIAGPYAILSAPNIGDLYFYGLAPVSSGAANLVINWAGANQVIAALISFTGANQTGGATTFYGATGVNANHGNSAAATITGPSTAGDISVAGYMCDQGFSGGQGNNDIGFNSGGAFWGMAANYANIGASPAMSYSRATAQNWIAGAVAVKHL